MNLSELYERLQNLTHTRIIKSNIARILNVDPAALRRKELSGVELTYLELQHIAPEYGLRVEDLTTNNQQNIKKQSTNIDCYEIPYWEGLPEEAKLPEITSIHVDVELVENHWHRKLENLRIIPMQGDCLSTYAYPIKNRNILVVDISSNVATREGIYFYTAKNNTMLFVAKVSQFMDGTVKIEKFEMNGEVITKMVPVEKQKEVDFRIIGRIVKNVSLAL